MYRSWRAFVRDAQHNHLLLIPAALYAVSCPGRSAARVPDESWWLWGRTKGGCKVLVVQQCGCALLAQAILPEHMNS